MIEALVNSQLVLYGLFAIVLATVIWHFYERRIDKRIFQKDRTGVFRNLHARTALYAFDHVNNIVPVDVRSEEEFRDGHIPGAINATYHDKQLNADELEKLDRNTPILIYCEGGYASRLVIDSVKALGFHTIYHIHRGFKSWQFFGGAVEHTG
ncbi:MAG: rhodanese-like domain-containing protein [Verrucomicrobiales bacterium]|nr:rhodanese-like domain-containing protein [Verrucomicrobiales bacterium]